MSDSIIKNGYLTALDIGSTKICCLIARILSDGSLHIVGDGYAQAKGIKNGVITHLADAAASIQDAIMMAEEKAERRVESVIVNISSTALKSSYVEASIELPDNRPVSSGDVKKLIDQALHKIDLTDHEVIHQLPISYTLDGEENIQEPTNLYGHHLSVVLHVISVPLTQLRNLVMALERCHVSIAAKVATPYASGLSVLSDEEKEVGSTVIDIGGGLTSIGIFTEGFIRYTAMLPLGAHLITKDIAQILKTPIPDAERIKTLYGCAFLSPQDKKETINIPLIGEKDDGALLQISRADLISIMIPRIEEMLELTGSYLTAQDGCDFATRRVVLTGGASLLQGLREKTNALLEAQVRLGKPFAINGLPDTPPGASFATCTGLLRYAINRRIQTNDKEKTTTPTSNGFLRRMIRWLMQNF